MSIRRVIFTSGQNKTVISLPILNLFQWFLFYIRDFIGIITLTEKKIEIWRKLLIWRYTETLNWDYHKLHFLLFLYRFLEVSVNKSMWKTLGVFISWNLKIKTHSSPLKLPYFLWYIIYHWTKPRQLSGYKEF